MKSLTSKLKSKLNIVKVSQGGSWAQAGVSRGESDVLVSPPPVSAKSSNEFDYSSHAKIV